MSKQTSVEWLFEQLPDHFRLTRNGFDILQQAKEMHKQEIVDAHLTGLIHPLEIEATKQAEQYYSETYKSE